MTEKINHEQFISNHRNTERQETKNDEFKKAVGAAAPEEQAGILEQIKQDLAALEERDNTGDSPFKAENMEHRKRILEFQKKYLEGKINVEMVVRDAEENLKNEIRIPEIKQKAEKKPTTEKSTNNEKALSEKARGDKLEKMVDELTQEFKEKVKVAGIKFTREAEGKIFGGYHEAIKPLTSSQKQELDELLLRGLGKHHKKGGFLLNRVNAEEAGEIFRLMWGKSDKWRDTNFPEKGKERGEEILPSKKKLEKQAAHDIEKAIATFELNTKMLAGEKMTTEGMMGWYKNTNAIFQKGFDAAYDQLNITHSDEKIKRFVFLAVTSTMSGWVNQAVSATAHEIGHKEMAESKGAEAYLQIGGKKKSIGEFFLSTLGSLDERSCHYSSNRILSAKEEAEISAGGININERLANLSAKKIQLGEGHIMDGTPYAMNKLLGVVYFLRGGITGTESSRSDSKRYVSFLQEQGFEDVTKDDIIKLQAVSFLLSGGTWSLLRGATRFIWQGKERVEPVGVQVGGAKIMMPELTTWLNGDNVSLGIQTRIKKKKTSFLVGLEKAVLGNTKIRPEITAGVNTKKGDWGLEAEMTSNGSTPYLEGKISRKLPKIDKNLSIFGKGYYGEGRTQREKRERPKGSKGGYLGVEYKW